MIFSIKHVDTSHHRRKAIVTAANVNDCIRQVEAELGDHIGLTVVRLGARPVLQLAAVRAQPLTRRARHG